MKIINQTNKVKCDMYGCKNVAQMSVVSNEASAKEYYNLCDECGEKLHKVLSQVVVPKAIKNPMSYDKRRR